MRPTLPLAIYFALCCVAPAHAAEPDKDVKALRDEVVKADTPGAKAKAYRELFKKVGKAGLPELMKDDDTGIALQAAWEVHKKLVKRNEKGGGDNWVYDPDELKKFVEVLKKRTKAPVPEWWAESITMVNVAPGKSHMFRDSPNLRPKCFETKEYTRLPEGHELERKTDTLVYTAGKKSVEFPKNTFEFDRRNFAGVVGEKRSAIVNYSSVGVGEVAGFEGKGGKAVWKSEVWASGLIAIAGSWFNLVEVLEKDDVVYVFGKNVAGMYLEAFDLATGKSPFRFSTSYVCLHSEAWEIK